LRLRAAAAGQGSVGDRGVDMRFVAELIGVFLAGGALFVFLDWKFKR
jgi:hypothetical protein